MSASEAGKGGKGVSGGRWPRIFTVEEANRLLPEIVRVLDWVGAKRAELARLARSVEVLELVATTGADEGTSDQRAYVETRARFEAAIEEVQAELARLTDRGVVLRDLDQGLVDFHTLRGGRAAFLCWKRGEERVAHWHTVRGGFAGRRPMDAEE